MVRNRKKSGQSRVFVETAAFTRLVKHERISDGMLHELQNDIINGTGDTIRNTLGLKKIRFATKSGGKSGGWRAIYADYPQYNSTVLIFAFPKNVQENLTADQTKELRKLKAVTDKEMEERYGKKNK